MTYIPHRVRLKDPELIERWNRIAEYARQIPGGRSAVDFVNTLNSEWELIGHRPSKTSSQVFFIRFQSEDVDAIENVRDGEEVPFIITEYKVDSYTPFIIRRTTVTRMNIHDGNPSLAEKDRGIIKTAITALRELRSGVLIPDTQELDEMLEHLRHSTPRVIIDE